MFTRQHYVFFAEILNKTRSPKYGDHYGTWKNLVEVIADQFEDDNERFDRDKFLVACGVD